MNLPTRISLVAILLCGVCSTGPLSGPRANTVEAEFMAPMPKAMAGDPFQLIRIEFEKAEYTFTLEEAARGVELRYAVIVEDDLEDIQAICQDDGRAGHPNDYGLIVFPSITGYPSAEELKTQWQYFGSRDIGYGAGDPDPGDVKKGRHPEKLKWSGLNWRGPSDTGQPLGDPFPPGDYSFVVSIKCSKKIGNDNSRFLFEVTNHVTIHLVE